MARHCDFLPAEMKTVPLGGLRRLCWWRYLQGLGLLKCGSARGAALGVPCWQWPPVWLSGRIGAPDPAQPLPPMPGRALQLVASGTFSYPRGGPEVGFALEGDPSTRLQRASQACSAALWRELGAVLTGCAVLDVRCSGFRHSSCQPVVSSRYGEFLGACFQTS